MKVKDIHNVAGRFDISDEEAARIADAVNNEQEFIDAWENTDWWTDSPTTTTDNKGILI